MKDIISLSRFNEITSKFSTIDPIVVVGDVGIDKYTFGEVRRISPEAPVPVLEVVKTRSSRQYFSQSQNPWCQVHFVWSCGRRQ
jgi:hypothetical protein